MTTATRPMSLEEFMALPDPPEGHLELLAGEVVCVPGGSSTHGKTVGRVTRALGRFLDEHHLGELLSNANFHVQDDPRWAPVPDAAVASYRRFAEIDRGEQAFEGAPELVIEVLSPSNTAEDIAAEVTAYFAGGAQRVWIVDPANHEVTVHHADRTARTLRLGETLTSGDAGFAVEGFELPLATLFA